MTNRENKTEMVRDMFNNIAPTYDSLNHILSLDIDKLWRRRVARIVRRLNPTRILDMATGTGDLAIMLAKHIEGCAIYGIDFSSQMLGVARAKVERQGLDERIALLEGDVEHIELEEQSVDVATVAFGLRNFEHQELALAELRRTIRCGGHLVILEFSMPRSRFVRWAYTLYSHHVLPAIGRIVSHHSNAYSYLPNSIEQFATPSQVVAMLEAAGFTNIEKHSLSLGIAHIYVAER